MVFVTVGTHEQQFDRLVRAVDELKGCNVIREDVMIQTGYSSYEPRHCRWKKMLPYQDMMQQMAEARIVITHGGPSSIVEAFRAGKIPIVVPGLRAYGEHVSDLQVEFVKAVEERLKIFIPVYEIEKLGDVLARYGDIAGEMQHKIRSNNDIFNRRLEELAGELFPPE